MSKRNSKTRPTPYVDARVRGNHLVRACPECKQEIGERTDDAGAVTNHFAEHWEAEHLEVEPERERCYVLGYADDHSGRNLNQYAVNTVRKRITEVDWQLVERFEDLPEGAPTLQASDIIGALMAVAPDDPHLAHLSSPDYAQARQVYWCRRQGDKLILTHTKAQHDEYDEAHRRLMDARWVLLDRHRDELPKLDHKSLPKDDEGFNAAFDHFRAEVEPLENAITKDLDAANEASRNQFYTGQSGWLVTINEAITAADISEEEIQAKREWFEARMAEIAR